VRIDDIRFLAHYDRWATHRILAVIEGVDEATWSAPNAIGDRGLGGILVHHLGATQRWRHGFAGLAGDGPRPERGQLPTPAELTAAWEVEWAGWDEWLAALDDAAVLVPYDDVPMWQLLAHVLNHGTQHRSEAAALLTAAGRSPGDLDMVDFAEGLAEARKASA
jgi:uncharacterized damage-inducible protein DinB